MLRTEQSGRNRTHEEASLRSVLAVSGDLVAFLDAVGPVRGLLLVGTAFAAWRAVVLHRLDDYRSPLPWAGLVFVSIAVLAMMSLST